MRVAPLGDVDLDGISDVAVASWDDATHVVSGATGAQLWRTPAGTLNGGDVWAVDRVDDVTGDGIPDVSQVRSTATPICTTERPAPSSGRSTSGRACSRCAG